MMTKWRLHCLQNRKTTFLGSQNPENRDSVSKNSLRAELLLNSDENVNNYRNAMLDSRRCPPLGSLLFKMSISFDDIGFKGVEIFVIDKR